MIFNIKPDHEVEKLPLFGCQVPASPLCVNLSLQDCNCPHRQAQLNKRRTFKLGCIYVILPLERSKLSRLSPINSLQSILLPLGFSDLGVDKRCISIAICRCGRCDYNGLCELVPNVLLKKPTVILETDCRGEEYKICDE